MFLQLRMAAGYLAIFVMPALFALGLWLERPDGHFKFPHLWPLKLPQAGRGDYGFRGRV